MFLGILMKTIHSHLSPKLILALLVLTGICVLAIGIIFIWYKRKTSLTSSMVGNLIKLVPSLNEKVPTLNSLLSILSELTPSHIKNALPSVIVPQLPQTPPDELVLPPVPYHPPQLEPLPTTSTDYTSRPLSLEMFNHAATDLDDKGVNNLKRYKKYLHHKK